MLLLSLMTFGVTLANTTDTTEYPKLYIVDGDTLGIILTIDQAQKLDNDLEIKKLLEMAMFNCDNLSGQYMIVISELEKRIAILEIKGSELVSATNTQRQIINELKSKILIYEKDLKLCDEQQKKKDTIISNQKKTINKLKWGGAGTSTVLLAIIVLLIL